MIQTLRRTLHLFDRSARRKLIATAPLTLLVSGVELVGLAHVGAFVQILSDEQDLDPGSTVAGPLYRLVGEPPTSDFIRILGAVILGAFILRSLLSIAVARWQLRVLLHSEADLAVRLFRGYLRAPYLFALMRNSAEFLRNIQVAVERCSVSVVLAFVTIMTEAMFVTVVVLFLFVVEPAVAGFTVLFLGGAGALYLAGTRAWASLTGKHDVRIGLVTQRTLQEPLFAFKPIRVEDRQAYYESRYAAARHDWAGVRHRAIFMSMLPRYYLDVMLILGVLGLTLWVITTESGPDALAAISLFVAAGFRIVPSLVRMLSAINSAQFGGPHATTIYDALQELEELRASEAGPAARSGAPISFERSFELDHVTFRYPQASRPALEGVCLDVGRGESVGVVGKSGAGKSTLVDLVLGLFPPTEGRVLVDGRALGPEDAPAWRRHVGYVPQEIFLMDDTLGRNVALGREDDEIDDDQVRRVIEMADLGELIGSLPDGVDTEIGERGVRLSGGQRQRVGLARALYGRPQLLVLDEATSALDSVTEARITALLDEIRGDLAMIVVAHRLSTVKRCERLYLLDEGKLVASGSFEELRSSSQDFDRAFRLSELEHGSASP